MRGVLHLAGSLVIAWLLVILLRIGGVVAGFDTGVVLAWALVITCGLFFGYWGWRLYRTREHLPKWFLVIAATVTTVLILLVASAMLGDLVQEDDQQFEFSDEFLRDASEIVENLCREQPEKCPGVTPTRFDQVKSRYEQWVEAVVSRNFDGQYELQVPPSQRMDCPRTRYVATLKSFAETNDDDLNALIEAYQNQTWKGQTQAGLDRTIVEFEYTTTGEIGYLDYRRVAGRWYIFDPLLDDPSNPLAVCNPK